MQRNKRFSKREGHIEHSRWVWSFLLTFTAVLISMEAKAQTESDLEGRVYSSGGDVAGTHVVNRTSQRATITDANGFFTIAVQLNDTLIFTAVQFDRKEIVATHDILDAKLLMVPLQESLTELEEVVVTPYNLSGDLNYDLGNLKTEPVITASTLGLLNKKIRLKPKGVAAVVPLGKYLDLVIGYDTVNLKPDVRLDLKMVTLWNQVSGKNNDLKKYAAIEKENAFLEGFRQMYTDSVFIHDLEIPEERINDFINLCAADSVFKEIIDADDVSGLWDFIRSKSIVYRKNNALGD